VTSLEFAAVSEYFRPRDEMRPSLLTAAMLPLTKKCFLNFCLIPADGIIPAKQISKRV
jgi:hypothetical protein